jgi:hypothetical protein
MKEIQLGKSGKVALVDDEWYEYLNQWKWGVHSDGYNIYAERNITVNNKQYTIRMHRLIMGTTNPKTHIDHINGNGLDNQINNLRECTTAQNTMNQRTKKTGQSSIYKGVYYDNAYKKYKAQIGFKGKHISLGRFESQIEAAKTYDAKAKELFGEFACPNFNDES